MAGLKTKSGPASLEGFDAAFRKRLAVAVAVSLAVNALVFGTAGIGAHYFLLSLRPKPKPITITRVISPGKRAFVERVKVSPAPKSVPPTRSGGVRNHL